jgi:hypothetical protein
MATPGDQRPASRERTSESSWRQIAEGAARLETPRPDADRVTFGRLLDHGAAEHKFRPSAETSYFVRIETLQGERVFWSPALKTAIAGSRSQPQVGDEIGVRENSIQPVTLITTVHDERGNVKGKRRYDTPRTHWLIEKRSFFDERMLAAEALRNERLHPREAIRSYPDLLPAYIALDSARRVAEQRIPPASRQRFVQLVRETLAHAIERSEPLPAIGLRSPDGQKGAGRER